MTVKALKKQLMAAIAMVVVSAIALSSSTYAWFANNSKVTATGMQVQATVEGGIEIAHAVASGSSATYSTSESTTLAQALLNPTSTVNGTAWYHASADNATASAARVNTYKTLTLKDDSSTGVGYEDANGDDTVDAGEHKYYLKDTFNIRSVSSQLAKDLTVDSVTVTGATKATSDALRVLVKLDDTHFIIYAPKRGTLTAYDVYSGYTESTEEGVTTYTATKAGTVTIQDSTAQKLLADANAVIPTKGEGNVNGGVDVQIYVYFEGEDANLYTNNFQAENITVTVNFSATVG